MLCLLISSAKHVSVICELKTEQVTGFRHCHKKTLVLMRYLFYCSSATPEPGEDPRVTRAKYFIRDEFLVSISFLLVFLT